MLRLTIFFALSNFTVMSKNQTYSLRVESHIFVLFISNNNCYEIIANILVVYSTKHQFIINVSI